MLSEVGKVIPHNHPEILPEDWVIRFISNQWIVDDPKFAEGKRISSEAWQKSSGDNEGMSVNLQRLIEEDGLDARAFSAPASIKMNVGAIRELNFMVGYDPIKDVPTIPDNPYHCQVWGQFSTGRSKALRNHSEWFVPILGVSIGKDADRC